MVTFSLGSRISLSVTRRLQRAASRGPKNNVWTAILMDELAVDNTPAVDAVIVDKSDWSGASGNEKATLLRIRGYVNVSKATGGATHMYMAIYVADKDTGVLSVSGVAAYVDEDILWTHGVNLPSSTAGTVMPVYVDIDVKSMRRINSSQEVRLTMQGDIGNTTVMIVSGVIRGLVRKGGN